MYCLVDAIRTIVVERERTRGTERKRYASTETGRKTNGRSDGGSGAVGEKDADADCQAKTQCGFGIDGEREYQRATYTRALHG